MLSGAMYVGGEGCGPFSVNSGSENLSSSIHSNWTIPIRFYVARAKKASTWVGKVELK